MNCQLGRVTVIAGSIGSLAASLALGADQVVLQFRKAGTQGEVAWHANLQLPVSATYPAYTIERSADGRTWAPIAGPVLSHYEFELGPTTRQTDSQWKSDIRAGILPPHPDWTRGYLVPGSYSVPSWVP